MNQLENLENISSQVRRDIIRMVSKVNSGHPGGSMSSADIVTALFFEVMNVNPANFSIKGTGEDLFYLSNGHISPVLYSVLARRGYFDIDELNTFRIMGSRLQGHPSPCTGIPGVRVASGSLGQGLSVAMGHAIAKKMDNDNGKVFVLMGDGELQEGQVWEAAMFGAARAVDNIVAIVDWNNQQIDGTCEEVLSGAAANLNDKFEAFGWRVLQVDGHDMKAVVETLKYAKDIATGKGRPVVILAKTIMGKGVDFMSNTNEYHGKATNTQQTLKALEQLTETLGDY